MNIGRLTARIAVGTVATALAATAVAAPAQAGGTATGTTSLAQVLTADTPGFDRNRHDFDILRAAVLAVLEAKPNSPVKVLTDGTVALTAFIPTDAAFQQLVKEITNAARPAGEKQAFAAVAGLGIDTVESVLLYHVVPGATIDAKTALKSNGAHLTTALGPAIEVEVRPNSPYGVLRLVDADTDDRNPRVVATDINQGNRQIAHAIERVLRPIDLA
ncbi:fasciclin domain-containing protein [Micromonospora echinofusca]|uniref:Fasciclin domain-containing protein n=1 Tax=Micromonospora echinofusca TaxID=47858 RepID=A0ABS3VZ52_MICEH|nr:fasciclin domain-containing protein [Micromonospora echinofusca]MBO4209820.1 fasciclin domain-containing protein [Micromonospora echinofusca]